MVSRFEIGGRTRPQVSGARPIRLRSGQARGHAALSKNRDSWLPALAFVRFPQLRDHGEVFQRGGVALDLAVGGQFAK